MSQRRSIARPLPRVVLLLGAISTVVGPARGQSTRPDCGQNGLDAASFNLLLNQHFSALLSPKSEGVPGTFLGVDLKDAQASVAATFASAAGNALTVSAHGALNDGVIAVFNDATLSGKFGFAAQAHFLSRVKQQLHFTTASCRALETAVQTAEQAYAVRLAELDASEPTVQRRIEIAALEAKAADIETKLKGLPTPGTASDELKRDSLRLELARVIARRARVDSFPLLSPVVARLAARNARYKAWDDARKLLEVEGFSFGWWSIGVSADNNSFNLFDPTAAVADQISKRTHLTRAATLTYSRLTSSAFDFESRYWAVGARAGWEDNLADLTKVEVTDRKQYAAPPAERVTEKKTTAFQGAYDDDVQTFGINADYYQFFLPNDRLAWHVFPAFLAKTKRVGEVSFGGGLLLSARKSPKDGAVANAEVFFNAPDLADARKSHKSPWKRGVLGLRVTFPFTFALGS